MLNFMDRLRPLVGSKGWDYCVLWQINENQRFLECIACCCSGAEAGKFTDRNDLIFSASSRFSCKDDVVQHQRTKCCELLSQLPSSVPLDSGIYAESFFSSQPRWEHTLTDPDPNQADNEVSFSKLPSTRVLIPVLGRLVELFVAKHVPEDKNVVDFIVSQCVVPLELDALINSNMDEEMAHAYLGFEKDNFHMPDNITSQEANRIHSPTTSFQKMNCGTSPRAEANNGSDMPSQNAGRSDSISDCSDPIDDENDSKSLKTSGKGQAKNLQAERKRRKKLNERLYKLRALVPIISKLDKAHILVDAIDYVKQLRKQEQELKEELEQDSDNDGTEDMIDEFGNLVHKNAPNPIVPRSCGGDIDNDKVQQMEPQVDVTPVDRSKFVIRVFCEHKAGGFVRLLEALHSLGLEVVNVNVTSCRMLVSNVFQVEMKGDTNQVVADDLKNSLLELTRIPSGAPLPPPDQPHKSDNGFGIDFHYDHQHPFLGHHTSLFHLQN